MPRTQRMMSTPTKKNETVKSPPGAPKRRMLFKKRMPSPTNSKKHNTNVAAISPHVLEAPKLTGQLLQDLEAYKNGKKKVVIQYRHYVCEVWE